MSLKKITINGNVLEPGLHGPGQQLSALDAENASGTKYILIQAEAPLSTSQKADLQSSGVIIQKYVSEDTYLCEYDPSDLETLRSKSYINYANIYLSKLKIHPRLKAQTPVPSSEGDAESKEQVDLLFHNGVNASAPEVKARVAEAAHVDQSEMEVSSRKVRMKVAKQYLDDIAGVDEVESIHDVQMPQLLNNVARDILRANITVNATAYRGEGQLVAVADTGFDRGNTAGDVHPAFLNRVRQLYPRGKSDAADPDRGGGHGTHVCGSVLGDHSSDKLGITIQGTAPEATLVMQALADEYGNLTGIPFDLNILFNEPYENDNTRIHTNSWGHPLPRDLKQGEYDQSAADIDNFVFEHRDMVICFAAGNDGMDADRNGVVDARQIGSEAAAKNCITVGASENFRQDFASVYSQFSQGTVHFPVDPLNNDRIANNAEGMAAFSSRGPTAEGRIKPDVTAPGTAILSAKGRDISRRRFDSDDPLWTFMSGTSMACPLVAGCAAVLREVLVKNGLSSPSAALIKVLLINGAVDMLGQYQTADVGPSPNSINGWGRVDLANSVIIPSFAEPNSGLGEGGPLEEGEEETIVINIPKDVDTKPSKDKPKIIESGSGVNSGQIPLGPESDGNATLKITIVWTDPPGALLQNDLDLVVVAANGEERHGNMGMDPGFDRTNNVEQILWHNVPPGEAKVIIRCFRTTKLGDSQDYAYAWRISPSPGA
ncbi:MAG: hypothetical protein Q9225_006795 [Loekoesia sp. 1 TL-2023]